MSRRLLLPLAAMVVAVVGLAGLSYGILLATMLAPPTHTIGRVSGTTGVPVVDTATGVLDLDGPQVEVRATAASGSRVFVGVARADDLTAYLGDVSRLEITRVSGDGKLTTVRAGTQADLPDPSGVDIWVASRSGTGSVSLTWPDAPGPWRVLVAADGKAGAPADITLNWARAPHSTSAPAFIAVGALLLVAGLLWLLALRVRRRDDEDGDVGDRKAGDRKAGDSDVEDSDVGDPAATGGLEPDKRAIPAPGHGRVPVAGANSDDPEAHR